MRRRTISVAGYYIEVEQQPEGGWDINTFRKGAAPHPIVRQVGLTHIQMQAQVATLAGGFAVEALNE